jgi:hypothetical protein
MKECTIKFLNTDSNTDIHEYRLDAEGVYKQLVKNVSIGTMQYLKRIFRSDTTIDRLNEKIYQDEE